MSLALRLAVLERAARAHETLEACRFVAHRANASVQEVQALVAGMEARLERLDWRSQSLEGLVHQLAAEQGLGSEGEARMLDDLQRILADHETWRQAGRPACSCH